MGIAVLTLLHSVVICRRQRRAVPREGHEWVRVPCLAALLLLLYRTWYLVRLDTRSQSCKSRSFHAHIVAEDGERYLCTQFRQYVVVAE